MRLFLKRAHVVLSALPTAAAAFGLLAVLLAVPPPCQAQIHEVVCNHGIGEFAAQFHTGVSVEVGAARNGELATRFCQATIRWDKQNLSVASATAQADVDAFGVDLGLGAPVIALQVKQSDADCCMTYRIYSLQKPAKLLWTIAGGDFFRSADTDFDGRVEIWTRDAAAFAGFENLRAGALAPSVVLRFENNELRDVSAEFQPHFDQEIAALKSALAPQDMRKFRTSGPLAAPPAVTARVLGIVCAYLYSGREEQAWAALSEMWPASDVARIKMALLEAQARGIRSQVRSVSPGPAAGQKKTPAAVRPFILSASSAFGLARSTVQMTNPQPIVLRLHVPLADQNQVHDVNLSIELVLDSAGKVHSFTPEGHDPLYNRILKDSAADWKFVPALKDGLPVAVQFYYGVSLKR